MTQIYEYSRNPQCPRLLQLRSCFPNAPVRPCLRTPVLPCSRASVLPVLLCSCTTVSRIGFPAHETTSAGTPVSRTSLSAHETTSAGTPVSRTSLSAHETTLASTPVSRTSLSAHETTSAGTPREHLELSLRTGKAGWSAFFGTHPHIGRKNGHRTAELFLL